MSFKNSSLRIRRLRPMVEALEDRVTPAPFAPLAATPDGAAGSLRDSIITANSNGDAVNTFSLQVGVYALTIPNNNQENAAATGDLDLVTQAGFRKTYQFQGAGAGLTIIDGGDIDRVFHVLNADVTVVFTDLTIRNGTALDDGTAGAPPGFARGGGILVTGGSVTLDRVVVEQNVAKGSNGAHGTSFVPDGGSGNSGAGGGIAVGFGALAVQNSTISFNQALGGRGGDGLSLLFAGTGNGGDGGRGGWGVGGGIDVDLNGSVTLRNSTVSSNTARPANGGDGGSGRDGGFGGDGGQGGLSEGGGLWIGSGTANLYNSTIAANRAEGSAGGAGGAPRGSAGLGQNGEGGGVFKAQPGVLNASSSIFGDNFVVRGTAHDVTGGFDLASNNLVENNTGSGLPAANPGLNGNRAGSAQFPLDPQLGPLQNNGGPTPTHALRAGSPALDAGSVVAAAGPTPFDQRGPGFARIFGAAPDIGAFELQPPPAPSRPQIVAEAFKQKRKAKVRVKDKVTGAVRKVLTPFAGFKGNLRLSYFDANSDGSLDLVVQARIHGKLKKRIYDAVTLARLA